MRPGENTKIPFLSSDPDQSGDGRKRIAGHSARFDFPAKTNNPRLDHLQQERSRTEHSKTCSIMYMSPFRIRLCCSSTVVAVIAASYNLSKAGSLTFQGFQVLSEYIFSKGTYNQPIFSDNPRRFRIDPSLVVGLTTTPPERPERPSHA